MQAGKEAYRKGADDPQGSGHRQRLRERFRKSGHDALADYEFLELLLTYVIPRKDTKPLAKALMREFGSVAAVLDQPLDKLTSIKGMGIQSATFFTVIHAALHKYLEEQVTAKPTISKPEDIVDFVRIHIGSKERECLMLMCLNDANTPANTSAPDSHTALEVDMPPITVSLTLDHPATESGVSKENRVTPGGVVVLVLVALMGGAVTGALTAGAEVAPSPVADSLSEADSLSSPQADNHRTADRATTTARTVRTIRASYRPTLRGVPSTPSP